MKRIFHGDIDLGIAWRWQPLLDKRSADWARQMMKLYLAVGLLAATGCALQRGYAPATSPDQQGVVYVADGAGDFRITSAAFRDTLADMGWPIRVEAVPWSHGYLRILKDQLDYAHARAEGQRLAAEIVAVKEIQPNLKIYLAGHSAGALIVVAAAECLPPDSIEGAALLAPSLSTFYDLRPSLRAVHNHMDVYYSCRDWGYLGIGTGFLGTSDRQWAPAGGRIGFQEYADTSQDHADLVKLRQHPWHPVERRAGNNGGHYGSRQPRYLRSQVLPLLFEQEVRVQD
jgi:hypothetical protein